MDKSFIMRSFNTHFMEMLDDILSIYPSNVEILTARKFCETLKRMNPSMIIKAWYKRVYQPYGAEMEKGNLDFFFQKDYADDLTTVSGSDDIIRMIDNVRHPLSQMSEQNRIHSMMYLNNLNQLSVLYHGVSDQG